jgi:hypothetical protein
MQMVMQMPKITDNPIIITSITSKFQIFSLEKSGKVKR